MSDVSKSGTDLGLELIERSWTKEFMEAGKERLARNTVRDATRQEIEDLKRENGDLKQIVAELMLETHRLKKTAIPPLGRGAASRR